MNILVAFVIATVFVGWAVMSRYCGQNAAWSSSIIFFFTALPPIFCSGTTLLRTSIPDIKSLLILAAAGVLNGFGVYFYSRTLERSGNQSGTFIVSVSVAMVILAPILSYFFNGEIPRFKQIVGLFFAVVAIYLLKPQ